MPVIEAHHVYKIFGRRADSALARLRAGETRDDLRASGSTAAVIDASFDVEPGEIFVVMGLSGSGKSTLIRMVNGLLTPTAGELVVDGDNVAMLRGRALREVRRKKVSMVFQHFALLPHRTVGENAAYGLKLRWVNKAEREKKAKQALEMVGLGGWENYKPGQLSGGMQQRVGLARALAAGTDVLLMDEAFSALDPLIRREMQDQLVELQRKLGKTILFITHDLNEAMRLGDKIAMMRDGRIEQVGDAMAILNHPASDYVSTFVEDVDRSRVLTAGAIMTPLNGAAAPAGRRVRTNTLLVDLFDAAAADGEPIVVTDRSDQPIGTLDRGHLLRALAGGSATGPAALGREGVTA